MKFSLRLHNGLIFPSLGAGEISGSVCSLCLSQEHFASASSKACRSTAGRSTYLFIMNLGQRFVSREGSSSVPPPCLSMSTTWSELVVCEGLQEWLHVDWQTLSLRGGFSRFGKDAGKSFPCMQRCTWLCILVASQRGNLEKHLHFPAPSIALQGSSVTAHLHDLLFLLLPLLPQRPTCLP